MSLFETLREISMSEREIDDIGKNVNTCFNQDGRAWVQITGFVWGGKDEFASLYLRYWGNGMKFGWGMWRGNRHTGTTYSLEDGSDLLIFFIQISSESICQIT